MLGNNLPGFLHQDHATISEDNIVYATVQKKINEDQEEGMIANLSRNTLITRYS